MTIMKILICWVTSSQLKQTVISYRYSFCKNQSNPIKYTEIFLSIQSSLNEVIVDYAFSIKTPVLAKFILTEKMKFD